MKFNSSGQSFEKYSDNQLHENPFCGSRVVPFRWTEGRTDVKKPIAGFSQFRERAQKWRRKLHSEKSQGFYSHNITVMIEYLRKNGVGHAACRRPQT